MSEPVPAHCLGCGFQHTNKGHWCRTCRALRDNAQLSSEGRLWDAIAAELADTLEAEWARRWVASHEPGLTSRPVHF